MLGDLALELGVSQGERLLAVDLRPEPRLAHAARAAFGHAKRQQGLHEKGVERRRKAGRNQRMAVRRRTLGERLVVEAYQAGNPKPPVPRGSAERGRQAEGGPARPRNMLPQSQLVRNRKALGRFSHREAWMHRVGSA